MTPAFSSHNKWNPASPHPASVEKERERKPSKCNGMLSKERRRVLGSDRPDTLDSMGELAITLSHEKKLDEAGQLLSVLANVARQRQDREVVSSVLYYLACGAAIAGRGDEAMSYLRQSIDEGFADIRYMQRDPDLLLLHADPRFAALIQSANAQIAAAQHRD